MTGSEAQLWQHVRLGLQAMGHMTRIESHATVEGQPDINYCFGGVEGNLELKFCKDRGRGFELRPHQYLWFKRRMANGGNAWVLAEYSGIDEHWFALIHGSKYRTLKEKADVEDWKLAATRVWHRRPGVDFDELYDFLARRCDALQ